MLCIYMFRLCYTQARTTSRREIWKARIARSFAYMRLTTTSEPHARHDDMRCCVLFLNEMNVNLNAANEQQQGEERREQQRRRRRRRLRRRVRVLHGIGAHGLRNSRKSGVRAVIGRAAAISAVLDLRLRRRWWYNHFLKSSELCCTAPPLRFAFIVVYSRSSTHTY